MIRLSIDTGGLVRLQTRMTNRANFLGSERMRSILRDAGDELHELLVDRIESSPNDLIRDLSPRYAEQKERAVGFAHPVLVRTGQLVSSITVRVFQTASGWHLRLMFVGQHEGGLSNARLAQIHMRGEGRVPKRDFGELPKGWEERWVQRIASELLKVS